MKILLTGATGYIGARLLPLLLDEGHEVYALVRREKKFPESSRLRLIVGDLLDPASLVSIPENLDAAYYLVHSMSEEEGKFNRLELECVKNFTSILLKQKVKQIIYLSGISHDRNLSTHLASRKAVEDVFIKSGIPYTILRCGMIIGSGSASFEIIRDLTEKLPVMIAPKWVYNKTQPLAISDALFYLKAVLGLQGAMNQIFEIGGLDQLTYKEMLLGYAKVRGLRRFILGVPVLTPRLSSYWLYFVTSTNFSLAKSLVDSLKNDTTCTDKRIQGVIPHECLSYDESVRRALEKIEQNHVISSWKNALVLSKLNPNLQQYIHVPTHACFVDQQIVHTQSSFEMIVKKIWSIGGSQGWYFANWAWEFRGFLDKLFGGVGLNRGRTNVNQIEAGDAIDFWRVLVADVNDGRLLLYSEMKLPGEAWLEFRVSEKNGERILTQTATFRPKGILGRLYWYLLLPIHKLIFRGMANAICTIPVYVK